MPPSAPEIIDRSPRAPEAESVAFVASGGLAVTVEPSDYEAAIDRWRQQRDRFFAEHYATPLSDAALESFSGLRYYPVDARLRFEVDLEKARDSLDIVSSTGSVMPYGAAGWVSIPFEEGFARMRVLTGEEGDLYIPFRDATCGAATYLGGRYVPVTPLPGGLYEVDFNRATNPYCAYDPEFSCPLPPPENHLSSAIAAGELDYP